MLHFMWLGVRSWIAVLSEPRAASVVRRSFYLSCTERMAALAALLGLVLTCSGQGEPKPAPQISLNSLNMEVAALHSLRQFHFDQAQIEKLQPWATESVPKDQKRKAGKASKECREKLLQLRKALTANKDQDLILKLNEELDALREKEKPVFDDRLEITEAARKRATDAFRMLKAHQLAAYLGQIAEEVADPQERLVQLLEDVRELKEEEWKERQEEIAEDVSGIAVGLDVARSKPMSAKVSALLFRARSLSKEAFSKEKGELEQSARKLIGELSAEEVLRHYVEHDLAILLSNPRLPQALRARLK